MITKHLPVDSFEQEINGKKEQSLTNIDEIIKSSKINPIFVCDKFIANLLLLMESYKKIF